jgi:hypothetical protein
VGRRKSAPPLNSTLAATSISQWRRGELLSLWPLVQALRGQHCVHVVNVQAIAHASASNAVNGGNASVAVVIPCGSVKQYAEVFNLAIFNLNDGVTVLCFSSVSVVHDVSFFKCRAL